jgi:hypothetical protein
MLRALWILALTRYRLKRVGFARTIAHTMGTLPPSVETVQMSDATIDAIVRQVKRASPLFPGRARCLEQSLALYTLLRQRRLPVALCLGVRPYRFEAHAWVEYRGRVLGQYTEKTRQMVRVPVLPV